MKNKLWVLAGIAVAAFIAGCATPIPPGAERGPNGTIAYDVPIEASAPGARIEVNGSDVGNTPVTVKIFGDPDGTFHDFGSEDFVIRALPLSTNQYTQVRAFGTGHMFGPEDRIPSQIYFDMNQPPPPPAPVYVYPNYYPPTFYYGPSYYYWPYYHYYPHSHIYIRPYDGGHGHGGDGHRR